MVERSRDWLRQAKRDIRHAEHAVEGGFFEWACFSAQQAGEKAVKGLYQGMGAEAWGHSVAELLKMLPAGVKAPKSLVDVGHRLDKAYLPTRYPNMHPTGSPGTSYTRSEAEELIEYSKRVIRFCEDNLPKAQQRRS